MQGKSSPTTVCALCREHRRLCKSHIIPEFLYSTIYDETRRIHVRSGDVATPNTVRQKGIWQHLLCQSCENKISRWERYADHVFRGGWPEVTASRSGQVIWLTGLEYASMKLFLLSILWRSGVSTNRFFANIRLGPHIEVDRVPRRGVRVVSPGLAGLVLS